MRSMSVSDSNTPLSETNSSAAVGPIEHGAGDGAGANAANHDISGPQQEQHAAGQCSSIPHTRAVYAPTLTISWGQGCPTPSITGLYLAEIHLLGFIVCHSPFIARQERLEELLQQEQHVRSTSENLQLKQLTWLVLGRSANPLLGN